MHISCSQVILINSGIAKAIMSHSFQDIVEIKTLEMWEFVKETLSLFMIATFENTDVTSFFLKMVICRASNLKTMKNCLQESQIVFSSIAHYHIFATWYVVSIFPSSSSLDPIRILSLLIMLLTVIRSYPSLEVTISAIFVKM